MEKVISLTEAKQMTFQELMDVNQAINELMDRENKAQKEIKAMEENVIARKKQIMPLMR